MGISRLAHFWNVPVLSRLAIDPALANTAIYPTVVQLDLKSATGLAYALKHLSDKLNLSEVI